MSASKYAFLSTPVDPAFAEEFNRFCRKHGGSRSRAHIIRVAIRSLMQDPPKTGLALPRVLLEGAPLPSRRSRKGGGR